MESENEQNEFTDKELNEVLDRIMPSNPSASKSSKSDDDKVLDKIMQNIGL